MSKKIFFALFFVSGFCALLYQTIWLRLAYANFGINTQVISVVVAIFMLGLVLGSWISGRYLIEWAKNRQIKTLYLYCIAEAGIGLGALIVPKLFLLGHNWLLAMGQTNSFAYLGFSALFIALAMLPWCFLIGTTIPLIIDYLNRYFTRDQRIFSFLYFANTLGAMLGVILTALVLIELLGFQKTLIVAAILNFAIVATCLVIAKKIKVPNELVPPETNESWSLKIFNAKERLILLILFATGLSSLGFEVIWTRLFTPVLQTSVYAFAFILFIYLLGTCLGLVHYRYHARRQKILSLNLLLILLSSFSVAQLWLVDPRLQLGVVGIILAVGAISYILGYLSPKQIDELSQGNPSIVSLAYAINLLGCIIGPLLASYLLLPLLGSKFALLLLALPLLLFLLSKQITVFTFSNRSAIISAALLLLVAGSVGLGTTYEEWLDVPKKIIKNDYSATVLATTLTENNPRSKYLMVNGVGMTMLTPLTKVMAHLPLFALPAGPKRGLVIAFGMGTTFRSIASWGLETTAVELIPSVKDLFPYFFADADKVLAKNNNHIVVDDGRRFLQRSSEKYDVITIDPPPPKESAGSSLLYSEQFYEIIKNHLTADGILAQWYPEKSGATLHAVARSLSDVFPYVMVFQSVEGNGYHFLASAKPINMPTPSQIVQKMPTSAWADLMEWNDYNDATILAYVQRIVQGKKNIADLLIADKNIKVTDDQPFNEYFLLRTGSL